MRIKVLAKQLKLVMAMNLILVALFCPLTRGQTLERSVFDSVPVSLQARLVERLKLLVEYQRKQQWEKLYDLLSELYTQGESKEKYKRRLKRLHAQGLINRLVDFTPRSVAMHDGSADHGEWTIFGCVKLIEKGRTTHLYGSVTAWREKGDWFFSDVGPITPIDGNADPCQN